MTFAQPRSNHGSNDLLNQSRWHVAVLGLLMLIAGTKTSATSLAAETDAAQAQSFRFVQICDTQLGFGESGYAADLQSFRQAVQQINAMKPDFVVVCGDLVNVAEAKAFADFKSVMEKLQVPCHCAAGNHDIGHPVKPKLLEEYRATIGKDYYHFQHKGYTFIVVNTEFWKSTVELETARQDAWFESTLAAAKARKSPVFVVGHHPLFLDSADEDEKYFNIPPAKRQQVLALLSNYGVVAMLSGHTHKFVNNTYQGIELLCGETTSKNFDKRPLGFRVWSVNAAGRITHEFVALETPPKQ